MKSPLVRGGGRVFGPKPHDYNFKLNKKVKDLAKKSAFAYKAKDGNIVVVDSLSFASPKTKDFVAVLKNLNVNDAKSLILVGASNPNTLLSSRNIPNTYLTEASLVNIFDVMQAKKIVLTEDAVKVLESNFSNN
jgi:large subunit ribosomal protein L4